MSLLKAHMNKWPKCQNGKKNLKVNFMLNESVPYQSSEKTLKKFFLKKFKK